MRKIQLFMSTCAGLVFFLWALGLLDATTARAKGCHDQPGAGVPVSIICGDPNLRATAQDVDDLATKKSMALGLEAGKSLASHQDVWFSLLASRCHMYPRPGNVDRSRTEGWHHCVQDAYASRRLFLTNLPTDVAPRAAYLLSGFERSMLGDGAGWDSLNYDLAGLDPMLNRSLRRVIRSILVPVHGPDGAAWRARYADFMRAMTGPSEFYRLDQGRYLFGEECERHACMHAGAILVDMKTGAVMLAKIDAANPLTIVRTACSDPEIQRQGTNILLEWAENATGTTRTSEPLPVEEIESPVCR